ncbi:hypothetical protein, partial [Mesorhizobium sp.]|uniref:hypothetical protein n=1 Tax=Mesorhizobium sp. TaxID=1871066 RepID=UPI0025D37781
PLGMELVDRIFEEPLVIHPELLCRKRRRRLRRFGLLEPTYGPGQGSALSYVKLRAPDLFGTPRNEISFGC